MIEIRPVHSEAFEARERINEASLRVQKLDGFYEFIRIGMEIDRGRRKARMTEKRLYYSNVYTGAEPESRACVSQNMGVDWITEKHLSSGNTTDIRVCTGQNMRDP